MKTLFLGLALLAVLTIARAADSEKSDKPSQAELLRSVSASVLDEKGFGGEPVQLAKGDVYPVVKESMIDVILDMDGKQVRVNRSDVKITEGGAEGDYVRIVSAKYGFPDQNAWEVKQEIRKRMPENPLTKPVKILVSDKLLRAKAATMVKTVVINGITTVTPRNDAILTITYEVNGERKVKEVPENKYLTLP